MLLWRGGDSATSYHRLAIKDIDMVKYRNLYICKMVKYRILNDEKIAKYRNLRKNCIFAVSKKV